MDNVDKTAVAAKTATAAKPVSADKPVSLAKTAGVDQIAKAMTLKELDEKTLIDLRKMAKKLDIAELAEYNKTDLIIKILEEQTKRGGNIFAEGVLEITWTANGPANALPDAYYDEFVLRGTTPQKPGPLWFKVTQMCEQGSIAWTEVPATGTATNGLKFPAALLEVLDIQAAGGHNH